MIFRLRYLVAAVGLWAASPLPGLVAAEPGRPVLGNEPPPLVLDAGPSLAPVPSNPTNQQIAEAIAARLRQSGPLKDYRIDIAFHSGTADLGGRVASEAQRVEVLRLVQDVAGVVRVVDHLSVGTDSAVRPAQAEAQPAPREPAQVLPRAPTPAAPVVEPMPLMAGPPPSPYDLNPPRMPPYAWPTYAPYNNYSRVAYPQAYPYAAWPNIGPVYPFPKIPLGWRSVKLEWQDGHWWFSKVATKHDWWRIRYW